MSKLARNASFKPALWWSCLAALVWCFAGILAGGWTTSINAGMAFLDWPLSNGSINPEGFLVEADQTAEHSHRLIMGALGLICIGIAVWTHFTESRRWVRKIAYGLPALVLFQGLLGGGRVLFDPKNFSEKTSVVSRTFAISHAVTALLTAGLLVLLVAALSKKWIFEKNGDAAAGIRRFAVFTAAVVWLQALLGALVRQHRWGIWDMAGRPADVSPVAYLGEWVSGKFLAQMSSGWPFALNAAHRIGALVVAGCVGVLVVRIVRDAGSRRELGGLAAWLGFATLFQIFLGVLQIWYNGNVLTRTAHHLGGAAVFCLAAAVAMFAARRAIIAKETLA